MLALTAIVVLMATAGLAVGQALVARHRAAAAADLSAISAAMRVREGEADACQEAARAASAQGARLSSCRIDGEVAVVEVEVSLSGPLAALPSATGRARAGPAAGSLPGPASSWLPYGPAGRRKTSKPLSVREGGPSPLRCDPELAGRTPGRSTSKCAVGLSLSLLSRS